MKKRYGIILLCICGWLGIGLLKWSESLMLLLWSMVGMLGGSLYVIWHKYQLQKSLINRLWNDIRHLVDSEWSDGERTETIVPSVELLNKTIYLLIQQRDNSNRKRVEIVGDLAHEVRTPITIIRSQLEFFLDQDGETKKTDLVPLLDECIRLSNLLEQLQNLTLAEAGQLVVSRKWFSLQDMIFELHELLEWKAMDRGIQLCIEGDWKQDVYWDCSRIKQVLINIIGNACNYASENSIVYVGCSVSEGNCTITIRDQGPGIPAEKLPYLFQRFYRGESSRSRGTGGAGIGLAIAREYVLLHDGKISVESEVGEGTYFTILIPILTVD